MARCKTEKLQGWHLGLAKLLAGRQTEPPQGAGLPWALRAGLQMFAKLVHGAARRSGNPAFQLAMLMAFAFILRAATFGHPYLHIDETFYFLVGEEMHKGAVPYVDIWDRKPFGLFLIYYLIVGVWDNLIAYQIAASLFAGATAWVICRIASLWGGTQGGWFAGALYLLFLLPMKGYGGQAPVFYNLLVAGAALMMLLSIKHLREGRAPRSIWLAMALAGLAITIKQTTLFEAVFFGAYAAVALLSSGIPKPRALSLILGFMAVGAAPTVVISAWYAAAGHWPEYWHAMVTSNLVRTPPNAQNIYERTFAPLITIGIIILFAIIGFIKPQASYSRIQKTFVFLWIIACATSLIATPQLAMHHFLPLLVPLCAASGLALGLRPIGWWAMGSAIVFTLSLGNPWDYGRTRKARQAMDVLALAITRHGGERGLFVYSGPSILHSLTGFRPMSPLVFIGHLSDPTEQNVSHLNTVSEVKRVLAQQPGVVVLFTFPDSFTPIPQSHQAVMEYVGTNCKLVKAAEYFQFRLSVVANVYGDCRPKVRPAG